MNCEICDGYSETPVCLDCQEIGMFADSFFEYETPDVLWDELDPTPIDLLDPDNPAYGWDDWMPGIYKPVEAQ